MDIAQVEYVLAPGPSFQVFCPCQQFAVRASQLGLARGSGGKVGWVLAGHYAAVMAVAGARLAQ